MNYGETENCICGEKFENPQPINSLCMKCQVKNIPCIIISECNKITKEDLKSIKNKLESLGNTVLVTNEKIEVKTFKL